MAQSNGVHTRFIALTDYVPHGKVKARHFHVGEKDLPNLVQGQVLLETKVFSIDPSQRGQMTGRNDFFLPQYPIGGCPSGPAVAHVVLSENPLYPEGMLVSGWLPWAERCVWPFDGDWMGIQEVDKRIERPSLALGLFGISGLTAYSGIRLVGQVTAGETVLVSGAAGGVGILAGQIARLSGAKVTGIAGSDEKCRVLTDEAGFHHALNYRSPTFLDQMDALMPNGTDVYYDNVGGTLSQAVMSRMRRPARIVECGQLSSYDDAAESWKIDIKPIHMHGLRLEGFTPMLFQDRWPAILDDLHEWLNAGKIKPIETEWHGLEALPKALEAIFIGGNTGKMVVSM